MSKSGSKGSKLSLQEYEDDSEGILVDWGDAASTKSVPARTSKHEVGGRNAISLYDSDSSDELRRNTARRSTLMTALRANTDDEHSVEDCMILSDDDDSEEDEDVMNRVHNHLASSSIQPQTTTSMAAATFPAIVPSALPTTTHFSTNDLEAQKDSGMAALFVDDKPWRDVTSSLTPWKKRKEKFTKLLQINSSNNSLDEEELENGRRGRGGIFRTLGGGITPTVLGMAAETPTHREFPLESSMDEDDEDDEDEVSIQSSQLSELDLDEQLDWGKIPPLPNSFLGAGTLHPSMSIYLDEKLQNNPMSTTDADQFSLEHSFFIRAVLQLLEERELRGVAQVDIEDGIVLKQGSLKKFSHHVGRPTWKVKYAEVRRASFCYYEDTADYSKQARKTIPLAGCVCKQAENKVGHFVFELLSGNSPRRLFMCSSEEERQAWMRVIEEAKEERKAHINLAPYQWSIDTYKDKQTNLRYSLSKAEYMIHFGDLTKLKMQLPIQWVLDHACDNANQAPKCPKSRTIYFWKFLDKQTIVLNGHALPSESIRGPERTIGALARAIMEYDRSSEEDHAQHNLSEVQAVSYARDVLMAVWKSWARDDSHYTLDNMCQNSSLVIVLPMSEDPKIQVNVSYSTTDDVLNTLPDYEVVQQMSGWVTSRSKSYKNWKNRFLVVSEGVLSYYEHANPRPHGLRGQVVLVGASLSIVEEKPREDMHLFVLQILTKDHERERQLSFRDHETFAKWRQAIQSAIDACTPEPDQANSAESQFRRRNRLPIIPTGRFMKKGMEGGGRMMKGAAEGGFKVIKGASDLFFEKISRQKTDERSVDAYSTGVESNTTDLHRLDPPTVQIRVESCRHYKIITSDPTGDDADDTWVTVRATTSQVFKVSGGHNGCFVFGDELVELDFYQGLVDEEDTFENQWDWAHRSSITETKRPSINFLASSED